MSENKLLQKVNGQEINLQITVDDREVPSGMVDHLRAMENTNVSVERLPLGDYKLNNMILFERKTVSDFAVSLLDGRLFGQACRMVKSSLRPVYILEGIFQDNTTKGVSRESLLGAVISLTITLNIPLLRSRNTEESAKIIRYAGEQMKRISQNNACRHGYHPKGKRKRQLFVLQGLPGIGPEMAIRILDYFGSVKTALCADINELMAVEGIGRKTAESIHDLLTEEPHKEQVSVI